MAISLYELSQRISSSMPLGTIVPYYGTDEPSGWKICDGRSCAGSELAKKLGISNVPDLRGRFIRMIGGNAAGMAVAQGDELKGHTHLVVNSRSTTGGLTGSNYLAYQRHDGNYDSYNLSGSSTAPSKGLTSLYGGVETRPVNMAFNYIIKVNTNVILYYVSNIIYKAIAIGKSLLSRSKEEVRRTMAISLNNHEDRIAKLEASRDAAGVFKILSDWTKITSVGQVINFTDTFNNYDLIWFEIRGSDYSKPFQTAIWIAYQLGAGTYGIVESTTGANNGYLKFQVNTDTKRSITITKYAYVDSLVNTYGIRLGLKQYYCFSNNILLYRLTQILFDSSLLGLFSQKGGARTI